MCNCKGVALCRERSDPPLSSFLSRVPERFLSAFANAAPMASSVTGTLSDAGTLSPVSRPRPPTVRPVLVRDLGAELTRLTDALLLLVGFAVLLVRFGRTAGSSKSSTSPMLSSPSVKLLLEPPRSSGM